MASNELDEIINKIPAADLPAEIYSDDEHLLENENQAIAPIEGINKQLSTVPEVHGVTLEADPDIR